jgi:muramoyltetrapeptide carboxypeptidase
MVEHADPFSANTDEKRYQQLVAALHAHDSKIIWTLRGGYGAARLIPILDEHDFSKHPKLLVGFSDLTALFLYFDKKYGWPCIHGTIIGSVIDGKSTKQELDYLKKAIAGDWHKIKHSLKPANEAAKHTKINAKIIGGNLELIRSSLGTSWAIDARDKVLFIEEVDLRGYALHRSLLHLQQAGVFNGIKGLIIGDIICKPEPGSDKHLCEDALALFLKTIHVPIFRSNDFGHGNRNYALIFGADATISSDETIGHLTYSKKAS